MKVKDVTNYLESFAPLSIQENYDNSGLILGDYNNDVSAILITLDCTEEIVEEAINTGCNLIIAHHPIIFKGLKKINGKNYVERTVIKAIKHDIAIYAIHTNLDNIKAGVNYKIAERIGLKNIKVLLPKKDQLRQLVFYCPKKNAKKLKNSLFQVGAGNIGDYENCSFSFTGKGTFKPSNKSNPFIGETNKINEEDEEAIAIIFPKHKEDIIIKTLKLNHPYEEIAYQLYIIDNLDGDIGAGLIGDLEEEQQANLFLKALKKDLNTKCVRHTSILSKKIKKVAVCGGSGSFLLAQAKMIGADIFISSDFKYHEFFDAEESIIIADIGHYESEQFTKDLIYDLLTKNFTTFAIRLSQINTNPIKYI